MVNMGKKREQTNYAKRKIRAKNAVGAVSLKTMGIRKMDFSIDRRTVPTFPLGRSKGYIYTLEVMLAVALILSTLVLVFSTAPEEAETGIAVMKQNVYEALFYMDQTDELRNAVSRGAVSEIDANLTAMLPKNSKFDTNICTTSCNSTELPANKTIVTVDYYIGGYRDQYIGKKVRVWIWKKF